MNSVMVELSGSLRRDTQAGPVKERMSDSVWQTMFEQMPDICIWVEPRTGRIIRCNSAFSESLCYDAQEVRGLSLRALAESDDLTASDRAWRAMAQGGELTDADVTVLAKGGLPMQMSARSSAIRGNDGEVVCGLTVWRDISQRRRSEMTLLENRRRLQTLAYELTVAESRERGRIAQGLQDEIGQILAMAKFKLTELDEGSTSSRDAALREELRALLAQAARAARSATFELSCPLLQQFGLQAAIENLGAQIERAGNLAVRVEGELPDLPAPEPVLAVVYRVVRELVLNAQRHARARQLWITLRRGHDHLMIRVCDDGAGFKCSPLPSSFTPEGGFGLVSAEAQMQAIGGRLEIDSTCGQGTLATVTLPFANM